MRIFRQLGEIPPEFGEVVATIGNFDGVHCGHQLVIARVRARADELGLRSIAVTFDPHPARALRPMEPRPLITPLAVKLDLLAATGLDAALVLPFDEALARMSGRGFAREVLRERLRVAELHEGENFRFGFGAEADLSALVAMGAELGFAVRSYAPERLLGGIVSSSRIRGLIADGSVSAARRLLGRPFAVESHPAPGRGYGTRYTVPTINLAPYAELLPDNGVYVTEMRVGVGAQMRVFEAVTNVGNRPTFGADSFTVESYLLGYDPLGDAACEPLALDEVTPLRLAFLKFLRGEQRWPSPEALKAQIGRDVARAQRYFTLRRRLAAARHRF